MDPDYASLSRCIFNSNHWNYSKMFSHIFPAVPTRDPVIEGHKNRYSVGDWVQLNCTSNASLPETELSWYVNYKEVSRELDTMLKEVHLQADYNPFQTRRLKIRL